MTKEYLEAIAERKREGKRGRRALMLTFILRAFAESGHLEL